jgi:hypothetical protein
MQLELTTPYAVWVDLARRSVKSEYSWKE